MPLDDTSVPQLVGYTFTTVYILGMIVKEKNKYFGQEKC